MMKNPHSCINSRMMKIGYDIRAKMYGEMKEMEKVIEYLKLAFERKKNMIRGEHMPDPWTDSSFARFMKNETFLNALKELD